MVFKPAPPGIGQRLHAWPCPQILKEIEATAQPAQAAGFGRYVSSNPTSNLRNDNRRLKKRVSAAKSDSGALEHFC